MDKNDHQQLMEEFWGLILGSIFGIVLLIASGIVSLIVAAFIIMVLFMINANKIMTVCMAMIGIVTALLIHGASLEFIFMPLRVTSQLWSIAGQGAPFLSILLSPPPEFFATFFNSYFKQIFDMHAWTKSFPLGVIIGSMTYGWYLNHKYNGVSITKRSKDYITDHKRVGGFAASLGNRKDAHTDKGSNIGTDRFGKSVSLNDKEANEHALVLGTTGSGKTVTISNVVESAINRGLPLIYIDGKGDYDLGKRVCDYAQSQNRPSWLFGMRGDSVAYDPLSSGGYTSKKDRIIELREWSEEHYKKLAEGYLQAVS